MATSEKQAQAGAESVGLSVLVPEPLRDRIAELAEQDGHRSIGSTVRALLGEALEARGVEDGR